ncbi:hypothetical protein H112_00195 [Trichophyton rubrum D6]|uniref:Uncharacterized protein n=2 Tax=Trichophyton TaxID=5550 RepID=A0A022WHQ0_TRIRU|nr:hypothetical protein H100_00195 [Trichophyton rubrum MR850]EZF46958.1 hypothetical protein H102_00194 [Trichophyton rubrum CBS 100081]EZF57583.1 hypothetical protein H103_00196 [Trichophyton rubrum CBS 288.86]EZF68236.1 hypothetical protein H104_00195 [Trichophyton rubrum CBS 289.86]EZF78853.1 hypothetical protein H105_00187 [Trichophyton soudanense CBS 452.61]EZF89521.1 hypothetical protein H110_00195 [Trichophyton rubrum MR1448]EZG00336.1 hypothetical protein H113_00196 [Trichophyton rub
MEHGSFFSRSISGLGIMGITLKSVSFSVVIGMTCNGPYLYRGSMYIHTSLHYRLEGPCISMHRHRSGREYRHGPLDVVRRPRGDSWVDLTVERVQCALRKLGLSWRQELLFRRRSGG